MNLDKNSVIGFVLLGILFFGFFWYSNKQQQAYLDIQKRAQDSLARIEASRHKSIDPVTARIDSLKSDSVNRVSAAGNFSNAALTAEQEVKVENEYMIVTFTNKGGKVKSVQLKNFKSFDGSPVKLGSGNDDLSYIVNTGNNNATPVSNLYFTPTPVIKNSDGSQTISFSIKDASGESITHQFVVKPKEYMIDWNVNMEGANRLLTGGALNFVWKSQPLQHEMSEKYERQMSNICFSEGNEFDYISSKSERKFEKPVQWLSVVQQFFNTTLVSKNNFESGHVSWARKTDSSTTLSDVDASLQMKVPVAASVTIPLQLYFGPNDYRVLKNEAPEMERIVNLGRDAYSFVRPVNKFIIMPVFDFFAGFITNYGWVIMLLTIFIRLFTSPLTYTSYLSGAKMKVMRPELDALKAKFGADQQGYAMEQMKLFREAGVNPLGGCIPALVQLPIFVALYSFFNSNIAVRGHSFLWATDLSLYDSIYHFPFTIPGFGDHLSLFTLFAIAGQFVLSIYNMSMTPTQDNPAMKYMPYIFPFMMLFVFNSLPSALTWYYTVSNTLTILQQFVIQKFIIDHDKILAKIDQKRKQPKKKSKWAERYEQVMESQKKVQDLKGKTPPRKK